MDYARARDHVYANSDTATLITKLDFVMAWTLDHGIEVFSG